MTRIRSLLFSLLLSLGLWAACAVAVAEPVLASCSWDQPGHNPFMGDVVAAVDSYHDIPSPTRERLKARMARRDYDDIVTIGRDGISGKSTYSTTIRDMHFGTDQVCHTVTRTSWRPDTQERGLVYCEGRECVMVPTVCRNVSRVSRAQVMAESLSEPGAGAAPAIAQAGVPPAAPGAGPPSYEAHAQPLGANEPSSFATLSAPPGAAPANGPSTSPSPGAESGPTLPLREPEGAAAPSTTGATIPVLLPPGFGPFPVPTPYPLIPTSSVPEPTTWALMALGLWVLTRAAVGKRQRA